MRIGSIKNGENQLLSKIENKPVDSEISFGEQLKTAMNKVNDLQIKAGDYKKLLATGDIDNLHSVMIATEKADIALQLTLSIRNKVIDAYREIMRMQL